MQEPHEVSGNANASHETKLRIFFTAISWTARSDLESLYCKVLLWIFEIGQMAIFSISCTHPFFLAFCRKIANLSIVTSAQSTNFHGVTTHRPISPPSASVPLGATMPPELPTPRPTAANSHGGIFMLQNTNAPTHWINVPPRNGKVLPRNRNFTPQNRNVLPQNRKVLPQNIDVLSQNITVFPQNTRPPSSPPQP